jgi:hypothetical protein
LSGDFEISRRKILVGKPYWKYVEFFNASQRRNPDSHMVLAISDS